MSLRNYFICPVVALVVMLAPLFCFCGVPVRAAAVIGPAAVSAEESLPPCHRHAKKMEQAPVPEKKDGEPKGCEHCAAGSIEKSSPGAQTAVAGPAVVGVVDFAAISVVSAATPIGVGRVAIEQRCAPPARTLLRLHCALTI